MSEKFQVISGQLVRISTLEFIQSGMFNISHKYAVVLDNYSCEWYLIPVSKRYIKVAFEDGTIDKLWPGAIKFIKDLSPRKIQQIKMKILLSI